MLSSTVWSGAVGLGAVLLLVTLGGCADMAGIAPQAQLRDASSLGLNSAKDDPAAALSAQWWRGFADETLNSLQDQALLGNPSLKIAQARLALAWSGSELAASASGPHLAGQVNLQHQRYTGKGMIPPPLAGTVGDSGTAQLTAKWELDFFGKHQAALQAALGQARAAQADAQAAQVLLTSQVAQTYFSWVALTQQRLLAARVLAQREQSLHLVQARYQAGLDTPLELRQSQGGLPQARLQLEQIDEQVTLVRNALAALIGQPNRPLALTSTALEAIKPLSLSGPLSAHLLGRRADVAAARWRVQAADKGIDNARARFYPDFNLTAFAGLSSIGLEQLLKTDSIQWGLGPALTLPIFDAGYLRANLGGKTAERDAAVESYNATVINAVHDVLDQLASARAIARQQAEQNQVLEAAQAAYDSVQQRYRSGIANALQVLGAENAVLAQRRQSIDLSLRALQNQVALARALGGGLTSPSPSENQNTTH